MTSRISLFGLAIALAFTAACGDDSPTTPTAVDPKFTAALNAANEAPPVTNADATATGTATITFHLTKDAAGNITAATADFVAPVQGFPAGTTITAAHIHTGAAGVGGGVLWGTGVVAGDVPLTNGAGTLSKSAVSFTGADISQVQAIINNPAGFYFNIHTSLNTGGAIRGQLVKVQ
jgi:hypothetical protein